MKSVKSLIAVAAIFVATVSTKAQVTNTEYAYGYASGVTNSGTADSCKGGKYYQMLYITNSATGTYWFKGPVNMQSITVTDVSGYGSPYTNNIKLLKNDGLVWCGNPVTGFPRTGSTNNQYKIICYFHTNTVPLAGQLITLKLDWVQ
jgi:hypothetical protein